MGRRNVPPTKIKSRMQFRLSRRDIFLGGSSKRRFTLQDQTFANEVEVHYQHDVLNQSARGHLTTGNAPTAIITTLVRTKTRGTQMLVDDNPEVVCLNYKFFTDLSSSKVPSYKNRVHQSVSKSWSCNYRRKKCPSDVKFRRKQSVKPRARTALNSGSKRLEKCMSKLFTNRSCDNRQWQPVSLLQSLCSVVNNQSSLQPIQPKSTAAGGHQVLSLMNVYNTVMKTRRNDLVERQKNQQNAPFSLRTFKSQPHIFSKHSDKPGIITPRRSLSFCSGDRHKAFTRSQGAPVSFPAGGIKQVMTDLLKTNLSADAVDVIRVANREYYVLPVVCPTINITPANFKSFSPTCWRTFQRNPPFFTAGASPSVLVASELNSGKSPALEKFQVSEDQSSGPQLASAGQLSQLRCEETHRSLEVIKGSSNNKESQGEKFSQRRTTAAALHDLSYSYDYEKCGTRSLHALWNPSHPVDTECHQACSSVGKPSVLIESTSRRDGSTTKIAKQIPRAVTPIICYTCRTCCPVRVCSRSCSPCPIPCGTYCSSRSCSPCSRPCVTSGPTQCCSPCPPCPRLPNWNCSHNPCNPSYCPPPCIPGSCSRSCSPICRPCYPPPIPPRSTCACPPPPPPVPPPNRKCIVSTGSCPDHRPDQSLSQCMFRKPCYRPEISSGCAPCPPSYKPCGPESPICFQAPICCPKPQNIVCSRNPCPPPFRSPSPPSCSLPACCPPSPPSLCCPFSPPRCRSPCRCSTGSCSPPKFPCCPLIIPPCPPVFSSCCSPRPNIREPPCFPGCPPPPSCCCPTCGRSPRCSPPPCPKRRRCPRPCSPCPTVVQCPTPCRPCSPCCPPPPRPPPCIPYRRPKCCCRKPPSPCTPPCPPPCLAPRPSPLCRRCCRKRRRRRKCPCCYEDKPPIISQPAKNYNQCQPGCLCPTNEPCQPFPADDCCYY